MGFSKYQKRGAYHWEQIGHHPIKANAFVKARYETCISLLKKHKITDKHSTCLDIGCGDGALTYLLNKAGFQADGIDTSELGIKLAKQEHLKRNSHSSFENIHSSKTPDESYDTIVCSDVIEHVPDPIAFLKDIHRILRADGIAVLSTPIRFTEFPLDKEHVIEWFPSEWRTLFERYKILEFYESHPVALMECMNNSIARVLINLISEITNPFHKVCFRYFALQYIVFRK